MRLANFLFYLAPMIVSSLAFDFVPLSGELDFSQEMVFINLTQQQFSELHLQHQQWHQKNILKRYTLTELDEICQQYNANFRFNSGFCSGKDRRWDCYDLNFPTTQSERRVQRRRVCRGEHQTCETIDVINAFNAHARFPQCVHRFQLPINDPIPYKDSYQGQYTVEKALDDSWEDILANTGGSHVDFSYQSGTQHYQGYGLTFACIHCIGGSILRMIHANDPARATVTIKFH
ncbi:predicted protein [Plenodomus lingam JN3]|uniref:Predicted protein n=2 Tax=Leptosphaeria maculans TaxID=5022 RepID=E5R516_LEPMJ|nr:predicted protein [Plenodomus lingam JN3]ADU04158.1 Cys1 [Plenodomus lingam]CBX92289.1 predicted protein [Plenodomus lingam JN3]